MDQTRARPSPDFRLKAETRAKTQSNSSEWGYNLSSQKMRKLKCFENCQKECNLLDFIDVSVILFYAIYKKPKPYQHILLEIYMVILQATLAVAS